MQAGIGNIVPAHGGGNGTHITDVFYDGGKGNGGNGHNGSDQHSGVKILAENGEGGVFPDDGQTQPAAQNGVGAGFCCFHGGSQTGSRGGVHDHGEDIGGEHAQQNGNDLDHALAPDIADDNRHNGDQCHEPVVLAVIDRGTGKGQADADNDGAGHNGREVTHDLLGTEHLEQQGKNQVHKTGNRDAKVGVGQRNGLTGGGYKPVGTQKRKGRTQKRGNLPPCDQMEQQGTQTGEEQGGGHIQTGDGGNEDGCAEHGEQMLDAQNDLLGASKGAGVVHGFVACFGICHK